MKYNGMTLELIYPAEKTVSSKMLHWIQII